MTILSDAAQLSNVVYNGPTDTDVSATISGYTLERDFNDLNHPQGAQLGMQFGIYRSTDNNELLIVFRGLEPTSGNDITAATNFGWEQWDQNLDAARNEIFIEVNRIIDTNPNANITIAGHSLGGSIAQYAAYDIQVELNANNFSNSLNLTTFGAPGVGADVVNRIENRPGNEAGYDETILGDIDTIQHYYREFDAVPRLGGDHFGGAETQFRLFVAEATPLAHGSDGYAALIDAGLIVPTQTPISQYLSIGENNRGTVFDAISNYDVPFPSIDLPSYGSSELVLDAVSGLLNIIHGAGVFLGVAGENRSELAELYNFNRASLEALEIQYGAEYNTGVDAVIQQLKLSLIQTANLALDTAVATPDFIRQASSEIFNFIAELPEFIFNDLVSLANATGDVLRSLITDAYNLGNNFLDDIADYVQQAFEGITFEARRLDPLAIDLDGSGDIEELPADSVYFDIDGDGTEESVSWISGADGFLARDLNGNGEIDDINELFGASGDGFADLAALDDNGDGIIDAQDAAYNDLLVWQDRNEDGITQADELLSVADDLFIRELPVAPIDGTLENVTEAAIGQLHIEDIFLNTDNRNAISAEDIPLDFDVIGLPELRGYGRVNNLSQEMSLSTVLKTDVQNLAAWSLENIFTDFANDNFRTIRGNVFEDVHYTTPDFRGKVA